MQKDYLFISGIQRSGTTAIANLLNAHSEVCVCIERYKKLMNKRRYKEFNAALFERDRLLDFSDGLTNQSPQNSERFKSFYEDVARNYDSYRIIGDKIPNNHHFIEPICQEFDRAKVIFIVRDIYDTGCSWQARAEREGDGWPEFKTADKAVSPWNDCNQIIRKLADKYRDQILVVGYEDFFDGEPEDYQAIDVVTDFLEVASDENLYLHFRKVRQTYRSTIKGKPRELPAEQREYIEQHADFDLYQEILSQKAA